MVNLKVVATSSCISTWTSSQLVRGLPLHAASVQPSVCPLQRLGGTSPPPSSVEQVWADLDREYHQPLETEAHKHRSCDLQDRLKWQLHGLRGALLPSMNKAPSVNRMRDVLSWQTGVWHRSSLRCCPSAQYTYAAVSPIRLVTSGLLPCSSLPLPFFPSFATRAASGPSGANSASYFMHVKCISRPTIQLELQTVPSASPPG